VESEDREAFLAAVKATKKPALEHRRMDVLLLLDDGWDVARVAEALFLTFKLSRNTGAFKGIGRFPCWHLGLQGRSFPPDDGAKTLCAQSAYG
jgi:hypothetical protein